ncbi:MAG: prepilin-type N-terminal cleavage/methylation domain-containing protein [Akkermansiaceae bacterium]|nr:prepilin-type N-terminal cleavage/methylation domain-containing protein [Akkermansiaceae bacterium]MCF7730624.1 prepilin-type N-terminal cleavage/methylation domain-containing protein [Akkermansiaceae bacterium]
MTPHRTVRSRPGFTLIELLVVMAVLSVVMVLTAVISDRAIDLYSATKARIVAGRTAAAFMRQFEADLSQRIIRSEARIHFDKNIGNDEITLLTQRPGYGIQTKNADRRAALVGYRVTRQNLERAASGYGFGSAAARPNEEAGILALARVPVAGPAPPVERAYQVIAPGLIRLEFAFLVREAETRVVRADPPQDQDRIVAVVATVATLDPDRSRMLDESQFKRIAAAFPEAGDNEWPREKWTGIAANLSRTVANVPKSALQQVRVYEGVFPMPQRNSPP